MHRDREDSREDRDSRGGPGGGPDHRDGRAEACDEIEGGGGGHLDHTARLWEQAFFQALQELRVEYLKARIKASAGKNLDATAKAVMDAMVKEWKESREREETEEKEREKETKAAPALRAGLKEAIKRGWKKGPQ